MLMVTVKLTTMVRLAIPFVRPPLLMSLLLLLLLAEFVKVRLLLLCLERLFTDDRDR